MAGQPSEKVTEGLDGLRERLSEYFSMGARFAKWRAVIAIDDCLPSQTCLAATAHALARYAALFQEAGLVPIVEPEVMMAGKHTIERCASVTESVLRTVFEQPGSEIWHGDDANTQIAQRELLHRASCCSEAHRGESQA